MDTKKEGPALLKPPSKKPYRSTRPLHYRLQSDNLLALTSISKLGHYTTGWTRETGRNKHGLYHYPILNIYVFT